MNGIRLEHLVNRYNYTKKLLLTRPEDRLLLRKLEEHRDAIVEYVLSDRFAQCLRTFNL